jgi:hypothetical protein
MGTKNRAIHGIMFTAWGVEGSLAYSGREGGRWNRKLHMAYTISAGLMILAGILTFLKTGERRW